MNPDISVIIPNYNCGEFLSEAINSALNQKDIQVEVVVVDDGSSDDSKEILESFGPSIHVFYQDNMGAPAARNVGWRNSKAEYIKFLDADDVLLPEVLKLQFNQIESLSENQIPYGQAIWTNETLIPIKGHTVKPRKFAQDPVEHILQENPLTSSPLHRRKLLARVGGFNEALVKGQEFDLHLRLVLNDVSFEFYNQYIYYFRQGTKIGKISNTSFAKYHSNLFSMLQIQQQLVYVYFRGLPKNIRSIFRTRFLEFGKATVLHGAVKGSVKFFIQWLKLSFNLTGP